MNEWINEWMDEWMNEWMNKWGFRLTLSTLYAKLGHENLLRMMRWVRGRRPPDTGFEIRALVIWGRARYLSVIEAPDNNIYLRLSREETLFHWNLNSRAGDEPAIIKQAAFAAATEPPPS